MTIEIKCGVRFFKGEGAQLLHMKARAVESFAEERLTHRQKVMNGCGDISRQRKARANRAKKDIAT